MAEAIHGSESMLVRGEDLDQLLTLAGEVIIASSNQGIVSKNMQSLFDKEKVVSQEIANDAKDLATSTSTISSDLHRLVQNIRTVDMKDLGFRTRRLIREISRKTGKQVNFQVIGQETTIDKAIIEKIYDPISHQLRNAVDHGIEDIHTRRKKGKPEEGRITLKAYNTEKETIIEIEDDGAGIDMDNLYQKGVTGGLIKEGDSITEDIALNLMCLPGISTSESVSDVSGRGVGMDVVKTGIESVGGMLSFKTTPDKGTAFTFRIPLASAVNIIDALVVRAEENIYAFPISNVVASISLPADKITSPFEKGEMINYLGELLPIYALYDVLNRKQEKTDWTLTGTVSILIIESKNIKIAFGVSEFLSPQKLVIIPFEKTLTVTGLTGTTVLGGRKLGFIVDVPSLLDLSTNKIDKKVNIKSQNRTAECTTEPNADIMPDGLTTVDSVDIPETVIKQTPGEKPDTKSDLRPIDNSNEANLARQEFIIEIEKLFPELNNNIFSLESEPAGQNLINAVFRLFHTIKGNLIMMGLAMGGETIHSVESVLDYVRSGESEITPEIMDIVMDSVSYIENIVQNMKTGTWEDKTVDDIIERSRSIIPEVKSVQGKIIDEAEAEIRLSHESAYRAVKHRKNKINFYQVYIEFEPDDQPAFLVACLMYKRICDVGDVLGSVPLLDDIEKGFMDNKVKFLFASEKTPENLEKPLKDIFTNHYGAIRVEFKNVSF